MVPGDPATRCQPTSAERSRSRFRPELETLEGRVLPSGVSFTLNISLIGVALQPSHDTAAPVSEINSTRQAASTVWTFRAGNEVGLNSRVFLLVEWISQRSANARQAADVVDTRAESSLRQVADQESAVNASVFGLRDGLILSGTPLGRGSAFVGPVLSAGCGFRTGGSSCPTGVRSPLGFVSTALSEQALLAMPLPPGLNTEGDTNLPRLARPVRAITNRMEFLGGGGGSRTDNFQPDENPPVAPPPVPRPITPPPLDLGEQANAAFEPSASVHAPAETTGPAMFWCQAEEPPTSEVLAGAMALTACLGGVPLAWPREDAERQRTWI